MNNTDLFIMSTYTMEIDTMVKRFIKTIRRYGSKTDNHVVPKLKQIRKLLAPHVAHYNKQMEQTDLKIGTAAIEIVYSKIMMAVLLDRSEDIEEYEDLVKVGQLLSEIIE